MPAASGASLKRRLIFSHKCCYVIRRTSPFPAIPVNVRLFHLNMALLWPSDDNSTLFWNTQGVVCSVRIVMAAARICSRMKYALKWLRNGFITLKLSMFTLPIERVASTRVARQIYCMQHCSQNPRPRHVFAVSIFFSAIMDQMVRSADHVDVNR